MKAQPLRILIQNSDSPVNRGDRAILVGLISLVRHEWPDAEITALSSSPERDSEWFGIRFLAQSPYSVNPLHWMRLGREARRSDLVLWGGGEIMKDYTNRLGLFYWLLKVIMLRLANRQLIGAFQGIGPTSARLSRILVVGAVNCARVFIVRDDESRTKLLDWGARVPVVSSFDPAVIGSDPLPQEELAEELALAGIDLAIIDGAIGFGIRRWFHYQQGGWLPVRLRPAFRRPVGDDTRLLKYRDSLADLADKLVDSLDKPIVFYPMHLGAAEGDAEFARDVIARMRNGHRTLVLDDDRLSPRVYQAVIGRMSIFVASRLHSAIIATVAGVPSFALYYVDKGRLFFEQLGLPEHSENIGIMLEDGAADSVHDRIMSVWASTDDTRTRQDAAIARMRAEVVQDSARAMNWLGVTVAHRGSRQQRAHAAATH